MAAQRGFTLIEVLMALTVFALIATLGYGALATAGEGFGMLAGFRDNQQRQGWIGRQLRSDIAYMATSGYAGVSSTTQFQRSQPLQILNDNRGASEFDELRLLVREPGSSSISDVRYYLDEEKGRIMRESRLLWGRDSVQAEQWDLGDAESWAVEVQNSQGGWKQAWQAQSAGKSEWIWPRALRVRMKNSLGERQWLLPIMYGVEL